MKIVYQAENIIDANLVKGLLENAGYLAFVHGEFLSGAMGELPAAGLLQVAVADSDLDGAAQVVAQFEQEQREIAEEISQTQLSSDDGLAGC